MVIGVVWLLRAAGVAIIFAALLLATRHAQPERRRLWTCPGLMVKAICLSQLHLFCSVVYNAIITLSGCLSSGFDLTLRSSAILMQSRPGPKSGGCCLCTCKVFFSFSVSKPLVQVFLTGSTIDVAVIQESKWTECMEYTTGQWSCVHSGCRTHKQGGLLVLVHSRIAMPSQLRSEHLLKGRLLHVRIPLKGNDSRHLHVFTVYQKTHDTGNKQTPLQRQQVWQAMHKSLGRLPARDQVVVLGDFNTTLRPMALHVGRLVGDQLAHQPEDTSDLETILTTYGLVARNTWYTPAGGLHTSQWGSAKSQIDYILVRQGDADTQARQVRLLHRFPVGAACQGGAHHIPLATRLCVTRPYWVRSGVRWIRTHCLQHWIILPYRLTWQKLQG